MVNAWKSEKDWSRITIDYDVGPYKWSVLSSTDDWLWDPFNFQNGVIRPALFKDIAEMCIRDRYIRIVPADRRRSRGVHD